MMSFSKKFLFLIIAFGIFLLGMATNVLVEKNKELEVKPSVHTSDHCCVDTQGWLEYVTETFTVKYPSDFVVSKGIREDIIMIGKETHAEGPFDPPFSISVQIFPIQSVPSNCVNDRCVFPDTFPRPEADHISWLVPEWRALFPFWEMDGNSANSLAIHKEFIAGRPAIHYWFTDHSSGEGSGYSENNVLINVDDTHMLSMVGDFRRGYSEPAMEINDAFSIIETIYSTIEFTE